MSTSSLSTSSKRPGVIVDGTFSHAWPLHNRPEFYTIEPGDSRLEFNGGTWTAGSEWFRNIKYVRRLSDGERMLVLVNRWGGPRDEIGTQLELAGEPFIPTGKWVWIQQLAEGLKTTMPTRSHYLVDIYSEPRGNRVEIRSGYRVLTHCSMRRPPSIRDFIATAIEEYRKF